MEFPQQPFTKTLQSLGKTKSQSSRAGTNASYALAHNPRRLSAFGVIHVEIGWLVINSSANGTNCSELTPATLLKSGWSL